jgi:hypothetical protein
LDARWSCGRDVRGGKEGVKNSFVHRFDGGEVDGIEELVVEPDEVSPGAGGLGSPGGIERKLTFLPPGRLP